MQKRLDQMNVHVHGAVSDLDGMTGMAILRAIIGANGMRRKSSQSAQTFQPPLFGCTSAQTL